MTAAEALPSEGVVPDGEGKKRKRKRKAIFSKQNITPQQTGPSSTPVTAQHEALPLPEKTVRDTPIIPINAEVAEQLKREADEKLRLEAFTEELLVNLNRAKPLALKCRTETKPLWNVCHEDDVYATIGVLLARKKNTNKIQITKTQPVGRFMRDLIHTFLPQQGTERSAIDKPTYGNDKFLYTGSLTSKGSHKNELNHGLYPDRFPYEDQTFLHFLQNKKEVTPLAILQFIENVHQATHINDNPALDFRRNNYSGDDKNLIGSVYRDILVLAAENTLEIADKNLNTQILTAPCIKSMNQTHLLLKDFGKTFETRIQERIAHTHQQNEQEHLCERHNHEQDVPDELGMTSWQWVKEVARQTFHPR